MSITRKAILAVVTALVAAGTLAGCSGASAPSTATSTPHATTTGAVTDITTPPGTAEGFAGALTDVTITTCDATAAPASFAGTVTNPEGSAQSYRIYVSVLTASTTIGVVEIDVDGVAAKATKKWSGTVNAGADGARCVLRVERTPAK